MAFTRLTAARASSGVVMGIDPGNQDPIGLPQKTPSCHYEFSVPMKLLGQHTYFRAMVTDWPFTVEKSKKSFRLSPAFENAQKRIQ
jgi:hypothetical protein